MNADERRLNQITWRTLRLKLGVLCVQNQLNRKERRGFAKNAKGKFFFRVCSRLKNNYGED
jgi:hypothetical protein